MSRIVAVLVPLAAVAALLAAPATAAAPAVYKGQAKSMTSDFRYGKVRINVRNGRVTRLLIESVTTSGCGGFMSVVFAPKDRETQIVKGSTRIRRGKFYVKYRPVRSVEDQFTEMRVTFRGRRASGTFKSYDLCVNSGRFSAKR
jgi:hypothetical protein